MESTVCCGLSFLVEKGKECPLSTMSHQCLLLIYQVGCIGSGPNNPLKNGQTTAVSIPHRANVWVELLWEGSASWGAICPSLFPPCSGLRVNSTICWWTAVVKLEQCDSDWITFFWHWRSTSTILNKRLSASNQDVQGRINCTPFYCRKGGASMIEWVTKSE